MKDEQYKFPCEDLAYATHKWGIEYSNDEDGDEVVHVEWFTLEAERDSVMRGDPINKLPNIHQHFFAASAYDWCASTPTRDLREVISIMEKYNQSYNLYLVPVPHDTPYEINFYQPQVEGTQWLGYFEVNQGEVK